MFALATLLSLISQVSGTPYILGGDTPAGTDCSGLASWVANVASGRPAFGSRFNTGNMESALLTRGFQYGSAPNSVVIGWNGGHAAVTLPDGTPVSSGEGGGVRIGGGGAYQPQFVHHMYLPVEAGPVGAEPAPPVDAPPPPVDAPPPAPVEAPPPPPVDAPPPPADAPPPPPVEAPPPPPVDAPPPPADAPADPLPLPADPLLLPPEPNLPPAPA